MPGPWLEALGVNKIHYLPRVYNQEQKKKKKNKKREKKDTINCGMLFKFQNYCGKIDIKKL